MGEVASWARCHAGHGESVLSPQTSAGLLLVPWLPWPHIELMQSWHKPSLQGSHTLGVTVYLSFSAFSFMFLSKSKQQQRKTFLLVRKEEERLVIKPRWCLDPKVWHARLYSFPDSFPSTYHLLATRSSFVCLSTSVPTFSVIGDVTVPTMQA